jgi:hypothetical protein
MRGSRVAGALLAALLVSGCVDREAERRLPPREKPPLRLPRKRLLAKEDEDAVMDLMDGLRGDDYLKRVKAKEDIEKLVALNPVETAPYLVQMLDEPQLDTRMEVIRIYMKHCRQSPDAVEMLIEVINDAAMSAALRADVSAKLLEWTGKDFGYRAWTAPDGVQEAGGKWKEWFRETGGYIAPPPAPPEPPAETEAEPEAETNPEPQTEPNEGT